jgi:hypothetical protein
MTRNGKIARIELSIRNELNERLADGEPGKQLVEWLNGHPDVQEMLDLYFNGRPVTEQNLSEWKKGGYEDWLRHQEDLAFARNLAEEAGELEESEGVPLSDRIAPLASLALARLIRSAAAAPLETPADKRLLLECLRELQNQRAGDHRAARLKMDFKRWEEEKAELDGKSQDRRLWEPIEFYQTVQNRENLICILTKDMPPDRAAGVRDLFELGPRRRRKPEGGGAYPAPAATPGKSQQSDSIQVNPTQSECNPNRKES